MNNTPDGWKLEDNKIKKEFNFIDFLSAIQFVNQVANIAENQNHHPDILIQYNSVSITTTTHDAGKLTQKDINLALAINQI